MNEDCNDLIEELVKIEKKKEEESNTSKQSSSKDIEKHYTEILAKWKDENKMLEKETQMPNIEISQLNWFTKNKDKWLGKKKRGPWFALRTWLK